MKHKCKIVRTQIETTRTDLTYNVERLSKEAEQEKTLALNQKVEIKCTITNIADLKEIQEFLKSLDNTLL